MRLQPVHRALVLQDGLLVQHPHGNVLGDDSPRYSRGPRWTCMFISISVVAFLGDSSV